MNPRQELIASLRGRYLVPVVTTLVELNMLPRILSGPFGIDTFQEIKNPNMLSAIFHYLESIAIFHRDKDDELYRVSELGKTILKRSGAFLILDSYHDYFDRLPELLQSEHPAATVNRKRNVLGSGTHHKNKFFRTALDFISQEPWDNIVDLGCGNGEFLSLAVEQNRNAVPVGVDLSPIAIEETQTALPFSQTMIASATDVHEWATIVPTEGQTIISMWFILHEFAAAKSKVAIDFLNKLHRQLPTAHLLLGEIVAIDASDLAEWRHDSAVPEFMLFHSMSGQGVLSWSQYKTIANEIPYEIHKETKMNEITTVNGDSIPSSFVWYLKPNI